MSCRTKSDRPLLLCSRYVMKVSKKTGLYICDLGPHLLNYRCQFIELRFMHSWISWINKLSIDVWFVRIGHYLAEIQLFKYRESEGANKSNIEKITFKVVQMKSLACILLIEKLSFLYIFFCRKSSKYLHTANQHITDFWRIMWHYRLE